MVGDISREEYVRYQPSMMRVSLLCTHFLDEMVSTVH